VTISVDEPTAAVTPLAPELVGAGTPRDKMNQCG
jgi:hypothetical protein